MTWHDEIRERLTRGQHLPDEGVVEELAQHAAAAFEAAKADGLAHTDARARVVDLVDAWCRESSVQRRRHAPTTPAPPPAGTSGLAGLWLDLVYGLRLLRRQPAISLVTIVTIALAVGATTTLASVAYGVLARPLPWPDANRLVRVVESREGGTQGRNFLTNAGYHYWLDGATTIDGLAGYSAVTVTIDTGPGPERVQGAVATASLFSVLQASPLRGRVFESGDELAANVALVSAALWRRRYGGSDDVLGQSVTVEGSRYTIVGVLPADFGFPERETEVWTPFRIDPLTLDDGQHLSLEMFSGLGRLKPGVSAEAATAEATAALRNGAPVGMVGTAVFGSDGAATLTATPLVDAVTGDVRPALLVLLAGVGLLFVTAIGGIATMQVARAVSRGREVAIRAAIGAGAGRIARQLWIEHLAVGLIGGALGLAVAASLHAMLPAVLPADFPRQHDITLDWRIGALAGLLALGASLLTAIFPMLQTRHVNLVTALTEGGQTPLGSRLRTPATRLRAAVMIAQVAVTVVLLVGAALLGRSFVSLTQVDRGYDPANVLTALLPIAEDTMTPEARGQLFEDVVTRLEGLPLVQQAAYGGAAPLMPGGAMLGLQLDSEATGAAEPRSAKADLLIVSPHYIDALGMRVIEGRAFSESDAPTSEPVVMVNHAFAREYLPRGAVDVMLPLGFVGGGISWRVIGVVDDVTPADVGTPTTPVILAPARQFRGTFGISDAKFIIRTSGDPATITPMLRTIVRDLAPAALVDSTMTMDDRLSASLSRPRLYALLLSGFSGFALLIAAIGLFAVLSHGVAQRRRELAVRLALGATPPGLVRLVVGDGIRLAVAGAVLGLGLAWSLAGTLDALLFGVTARDPMIYALVGLAVVLVAGLASAGPALVAARVDPVKALRAG